MKQFAVFVFVCHLAFSCFPSKKMVTQSPSRARDKKTLVNAVQESVSVSPYQYMMPKVEDSKLTEPTLVSLRMKKLKTIPLP